MSSFQHNDEIYRSRIMVRYLSRRLDAETQDAFEDHYLSCPSCFEELRATELLILGLDNPSWKRPSARTLPSFALPRACN